MTDACLYKYVSKIITIKNALLLLIIVKTCSQEQEEVLRKLGSFPSGHMWPNRASKRLKSGQRRSIRDNREN